jgi:hypothetical protein
MPGKGSMSIAFPLTLIAVGILLRYWPALLIVWGVGMILAARKG